MTIFNWGESPTGKWTLIIQSISRNPESPSRGKIQYFGLRLFGTTKNIATGHDSDKLVSRFIDSPPSASFIPSYDQVKTIYVEEKKLSRETRIVDRIMFEKKFKA
jgi:hypothetical protein